MYLSYKYSFIIAVAYSLYRLLYMRQTALSCLTYNICCSHQHGVFYIRSRFWQQASIFVNISCYSSYQTVVPQVISALASSVSQLTSTDTRWKPFSFPRAFCSPVCFIREGSSYFHHLELHAGAVCLYQCALMQETTWTR